MKKYEGKDICCTCSCKDYKGEDIPCDICFRNSQYIETYLNCKECLDDRCKFRKNK